MGSPNRDERNVLREIMVPLALADPSIRFDHTVLVEELKFEKDCSDSGVIRAGCRSARRRATARSGDCGGLAGGDTRWIGEAADGAEDSCGPWRRVQRGDVQHRSIAGCVPGGLDYLAGRDDDVCASTIPAKL
jgi:hypothetical protein